LIPAYFLGIGGSFQLLSREKVRAPGVIQDLGLEWLWRLTQDPKRLFKRYYSDCKFLILITIKGKAQRVHDSIKKWT
jgi:N-acetylglucosaminyldiphosphoundecaprenol N-acetyl-beta-D-mannosaminyltransferase